MYSEGVIDYLVKNMEIRHFMSRFLSVVQNMMAQCGRSTEPWLRRGRNTSPATRMLAMRVWLLCATGHAPGATMALGPVLGPRRHMGPRAHRQQGVRRWVLREHRHPELVTMSLCACRGETGTTGQQEATVSSVSLDEEALEQSWLSASQAWGIHTLPHNDYRLI